MKRLVFTLFISFCSFYSFGQKVKLAKKSYSDKYKIYKSSEKPTSTASSFFVDHKSAMGLTEHDEMELIRSSSGMHQMEHHKYKQTYKGIPVFGVSYNVHTKAGNVVSANGSYLAQIDISTEHKMSPEEVIKIAKLDMNAEEYAWEDSAKNSGMPTIEPIPELVIIDRALPKISGNYALCYKLDLYSTKPLNGKEYFIDVHTREVICKLELLHDHSVPGKGASKYYGEVDITVDSISPQKFVLIDSTRGADGITVSSTTKDYFESDSSFFDLADDDKNEVAVDACWCTARFYDLLKDEFDWLGLDNNDRSFNIGIRAFDRQDYVNAYWSSTTSMAWFGNGDCNRGPLTTLEVVGHEFMHGVIDHTSDLIYAEESGAINESLADVMGKALEYHYDPGNFKWEIGHSFILNDQLESFRFMADPHRKQHPAYYQGINWRDGANVHTNSSIGNLWYYYLSEGGQGVHEGGQGFDIEGIGIEEAAKFIFFVNRFYLTENSDYNEYYESSLLAAEEYFNGSVQMIENIDEAWKAVGLPTVQVGENILDLSIMPQGFTRECAQSGDYLPLSFTVVNSGNLPYTADMGAEVITTFNNGGVNVTDVVSIDQDLLPGEEMAFSLDELLLVDTDDVINVQHELTFALDERLSNNEGSSFMLLYFHERDNLSVRITSATGKCFSDEVRIVGRITNETCTTVPAGLVVGINIHNENGELLYSDDYEIVSSIFPFGNAAIDTIFEIEVSETTDLEFEVVYDLDNDTSDNFENETLVKLHTVGTDYLNTFSNVSDIGNGVVISTNDAIDPLYNWSQNSFFITTGEDIIPDNPLCFEKDRNWDEEVSDNSNVTANIGMCVDLVDNQTPEVIFDLVQFRNSESFAEVESSSLRVAWTDENGESSEVIQGLQEGLLTNQRISLPSEFKGELEFKFIENSGSTGFSFDLLDYDVSLLDNLRFNNSVAVKDFVEEPRIILFPNPTGDVLSIITKDTFDNIRIRDLNGRVLMVTEFRNKIDVSNLEIGYYILELIMKDDRILPSSFIKF